MDWPIVFMSGMFTGLVIAMMILTLSARVIKAYNRTEDTYDNDYEGDEDEDEDEEEELEPIPAPSIHRPKGRQINV